MLYRLPTNETLRPYVKQILSLMLKLLEIDNEENVLVCLKIIIELHKQYKPAFSSEVSITKMSYQLTLELLPVAIDIILGIPNKVTVGGKALYILCQTQWKHN